MLLKQIYLHECQGCHLDHVPPYMANVAILIAQKGHQIYVPTVV